MEYHRERRHPPLLDVDDLDRAGIGRFHGATFEILRDISLGLASRAVGFCNPAEMVLGALLEEIRAELPAGRAACAVIPVDLNLHERITSSVAFRKREHPSQINLPNLPVFPVEERNRPSSRQPCRAAGQSPQTTYQNLKGEDEES
jgi:hypothetical protein